MVLKVTNYGDLGVLINPHVPSTPCLSKDKLNGVKASCPSVDAEARSSLPPSPCAWAKARLQGF